MKKTLFIILGLILSLSISAQDFKLFKKETFKDKEGNSLLYRALYPKNFDKKKSYPLLLFLHGMGERGFDNESQLKYITPLLLDEREKAENEVIVILPQCPEDDMWISPELRDDLKSFQHLYEKKEYPITKSLRLVDELLSEMLDKSFVDKERVSIMGLSMGGFGTLDLLSRRPDTFAKAVPICGGGVIAFAERYSPNTAIKLFHGSDDTAVSPDLSRALYDRLQTLEAEVSYKEYPGIGHNSWDDTFKEPGLIKWLTTKSDVVRYQLTENIAYTNGIDSYENERCKLDIYYPTNEKDFSTIVWFHGGGLEGGEKFIPEGLKKKGVAIVSVNYRLSPKVTAPTYIEDAAAAVAWTYEHIEKYGGDPEKIYIAGHSAGGYLALMLGLDKSYLSKHGINVDNIKGLIPISGQTITHNAIRKEMNLSDDIPLIQKYAPLNQIRENIPPTLLITGDRKLEIASRFEENQYLESSLKAKGNDVTLYELPGFDHNSVLDPAYHLMINWISNIEKGDTNNQE